MKGCTISLEQNCLPVLLFIAKPGRGNAELIHKTPFAQRLVHSQYSTMKDRFPIGLPSRRNRGQYGDYMLQSRTGSDKADKGPMTIEYDNNFQPELNEASAAEELENEAVTEDYKEELMLIESGNFVLTAPSLANVIDMDQREEPPPPDIGGLGRSRTESFEDHTGIEKTYTTFVNVAEDQIYPLELKYFLEAAIDEKAHAQPKKKRSKNISSRRTMVTKETKSSKPSSDKVEEKGSSDSVNGESKKFRLFPNLRDAATRRSRRIDAVRQRIFDGKKSEKRDKTESKEFDTAPRSSEIEPREMSWPKENAMKKSDTAESPLPEMEQSDATSPLTVPGPTLQELAEKILGKEVPQSEVQVYDFTKSKRKNKKKKKNPEELHGSTSFPVLSSPDMSWDCPKTTEASQDDGVVEYSSKAGATNNDISDTVTVAHGVEAVYPGTQDNSPNHLVITTEKSKIVPNDVPLLSTEKVASLETGSNLSGDKTFAFSRSFDDIYHSSIVQSIKNEISTTEHPPRKDSKLSASPDPAQMDFKWFSFGRQQKQPETQQPTDTSENPAEAQPCAIDERDEVPSKSDARLAIDNASEAIVTNSRDVNHVVDGENEASEKNTSTEKANAGKSKIKKVRNGKPLDKDAAVQEVNEISEHYVSFNSVRPANDDETSVISDRSDKVVSNFVASFGKLVSLYARKVSNVIFCEPMELNGKTLVEDLTFQDDDEVTVVSGPNENAQESPLPESVLIESSLDAPMSSPNDAEATNEEKALEEVPVSKRVITMTSLSRNSSVSMVSHMSSKTYDSEVTGSDDSDDDGNITRTSTATSEWEEGVKTRPWCACNQ